MRCDEVRPLLAEKALGELDPCWSADLERHLEGCSACREVAGREDGTDAALRRAFVTSKPSGIDSRLVLAIERRRSSAPFTGAERAILIVGVVVLLLAGVVGSQEWAGLVERWAVPALSLEVPRLSFDVEWGSPEIPRLGWLVVALLGIQVAGVTLLLGRRRGAA
ncbi:MAG: hypothetical protein L6R30_23745 [Thermoanaerobaculia bacterium]|nr:hypothetical protein [Thermoanaerobaculia bacterium]MCK6685428.1 hypothetical protein [Thermoanaerobaculia bacterium]